ncbi:MGH1-like glycoside hydrolase domain-containing protein [Rhizosphaericola mali]|uniref:Glucosidase n=1 Tax=Rhizosphaericola mali TaxID=2545455 RepID=A0A5P2G3F7_9BACT|nr:glucosidase [Rhizosphaericola mali]QES89737.1 glucosidase [Rhizosphaericola mali]
MSPEEQRLIANQDINYYMEEWGPYLSERQWGTVREDFSENGDAWNYFPFSHAHKRVYRWGEDGLGGLTDIFENLCFSVALWNGKDPILKERLFGLGNSEGNHGEDVKELYYYLDNVPSHYYMQFLYKYPQAAFPYTQLVEENARRSTLDKEFEILDTGVFDDNKYFDVQITYAKYSKRDIGIKIEITNRGRSTAPLTVLPTLWFYNRWCYNKSMPRPEIREINAQCVQADHYKLGRYYLYFQKSEDRLFTENETNFAEIYEGRENESEFTKDAFHKAIIQKIGLDKLREKKSGTKFSPVYQYKIAPGGTRTIHLRLADTFLENPFEKGSEYIFNLRKAEADAFYKTIIPAHLSDDLKNIQRQAYAGLLWSKQYYHFDIERWLSTSDGIAPVSEERKLGRNHEWVHLKNQNVILMPDKWEYPWYAAWDLAFQCIAVARVDAALAKNQLVLIMREWYMKPDGQLPAYEWSFGDVNPPLQAWSALEVYQIEKRNTGTGDISFLKRVFQKLIINFTWWINRKDPNGNNIFEGGFLGLDNIGVFNRNHTPSGNMRLEQADGTSWMGMYALNMMDIALEIALNDSSFEDMGTKFFEHFVLIAEALNEMGMWNEEDKFYYDTLAEKGGNTLHLRIQSIVGLTTMFAVSVISRTALKKLADFNKRINWFENYRKINGRFWPNEEKAESERILLSLVPKDRLIALLSRILNEDEFLSEVGIRALSKYHKANPYSVNIGEEHFEISYDPGDSVSDFFGGNSNWRGPVWIPINYLLIKSIRKYGKFYEDSLQVEYPTGSGDYLNLEKIADEISLRVIGIFTLDQENGRKYIDPAHAEFYKRPENRNLMQFFEYFHGDSGRGLGASHQTGWTALVAELIDQVKDRLG